jgi:hypothetical protein
LSRADILWKERARYGGLRIRLEYTYKYDFACLKNSTTLTYAKHRITNALGESVNAKIEKAKRMACGFRNREHYKTAIYFHCGGLDLYPRPATHSSLRWATL